ncbi:MAG: RidA family protein [Candidatus Marinimicrobia bacterium]|nr:RidA family protein [Candidatus Neomarinimicrobiota bacterium]MCF7840403.1 RidA family protein [Candidatus Neomarinimicrobiota bacterium]
MKTTIQTDSAPQALGPYSQAVEYKGMVYTSGQIAMDAETGRMIEGEFSTRVHQVMHNLYEVLKAAGTDFTKVVKTTIYVTDLGKFGELNTIYGEYMGESRPARATVQVAALPLGTDVEIEMVAYK